MITDTDDIPVQVTDSTVLLDVQQWGAYQGAGLISEKELALLDRFDRKPLATQLELFDEQPAAYAVLLLSLVDKINKEAPIRYTMALISQLIRAGRSRAFLDASGANAQFPWSPFEKVLKRSYSEFYLNATAAALMGRLIEEATVAGRAVADDIVTFLFGFLDEQLHKKDADSVRVGCLGLRPLLGVEVYRRRFAAEAAATSGVDTLARALRLHSKSVQLVYEAAYCLWLLTFSAELVAAAPSALVRALVECVRTQKKEKVLRVCVAALTALCAYGVPRVTVRADNNNGENADEHNNNNNNDDDAENAAAHEQSTSMLDDEPAVREAKRLTAFRHAEVALEAGLQKPLASLRARRWADEELASDLEMLSKALARSVRDLSSFDKYKKEVYSGQLDWSPPHKSETFWHENVDKFEENDFRLIKTLKLLAQNPNAKIASIACYDLGEFARIHTNGKQVLESTGAKAVLISLMSGSKVAEVQKQALFAIQKIMVSKYDLLTR